MSESQEIIADSAAPVTDQWLVRTSQNLLHGPYSREEICAFIGEGKLTTLDEVCQASGYWFFLHETAEVKKQLGVNPPLPQHGSEDEVTETEIRTKPLSSLNEEEIKPEVDPLEDPAGTTVARSEVQAVSGDERDKAAAEAVHRALRRSHQREEGSERPEWLRKFESLSFWKTITIFLIIVTAALFISIVRLIRD